MSADKKKTAEPAGHGSPHDSHAHEHHPENWVMSGPWANAWKIFAVIGVIGLAGAAFGFTTDARRFAFSWLFAFITCLAIALGSIFFVLVQHLTSAGWSVTVRRTAEFFSYGILALIPLFIPILLCMGHLFPWVDGGHGAEAENASGGHHSSLQLVAPAHAQEHAAPHAAPAAAPAAAAGHAPAAAAAGAPADHAAPHGNGTQAQEHATHEAHQLIHSEVMSKKSAYLNKTFFYIRALLYFLIWTVLAVRLFGLSAQQDSSKDPKLTVRAQAFAPGATLLFALSLTFAAFDWIMALEPSWFSTIFGVYYFATGVVSSYAVIILVTMALRTSGPLAGAVTPEHYHDLGKLMFGFLVFWAYIGFSQFMLIWYAALPEETTWYHNRWDFGPWAKVSMAILIGHFVIPFFWLMSRNFKRNLGRLQIGAGILLVMHVVDIYWFVMPNYKLASDDFSFNPLIDISCLLAVGGIYGAFVFYRMTKHFLVPVGDPRLERSLHFQNA